MLKSTDVGERCEAVLRLLRLGQPVNENVHPYREEIAWLLTQKQVEVRTKGMVVLPKAEVERMHIHIPEADDVEYVL